MIVVPPDAWLFTVVRMLGYSASSQRVMRPPQAQAFSMCTPSWQSTPAVAEPPRMRMRSAPVSAMRVATASYPAAVSGVLESATAMHSDRPGMSLQL